MALSKRNRRGLFGLMLLCLIIAITPRVLNAMFKVEKPIISFEEARKIHLEITAKKNRSKQSNKNYSKSRFKKPPTKFHPENYQLSDWMKLGLSEKQSAIVMKYSERGITDEEQLKRIFVIPEELVILLKDSIIYSPKQSFAEKRNWEKEKNIESIELNTCIKEDLVKLPGIGDFFATKIIEYREQLGGFHSTSQLLEVWKFDNEKLDKISPYLTLDGKTEKLNINSAELEELKNHPYISYTIANSIVKMRAQNSFKNIEDIKRSKLIDEEYFEKIKPYLECK